MPSFWDRLREQLRSSKDGLTLPAAGKARDSRPGIYPNTFPLTAADPTMAQEPFFDPALKQFQRAFRPGEPVFASGEVEREWRSARAEVMDHLLELANCSPWKENMVLRGSLLLKAWLGDAAREPGDIDWVVRPASVEMRSEAGRVIVDELIHLARQYPLAGRAAIDAARITTDEIWTYERVPGKRIAFPWTAPGLPAGVAGMDLVFGEELWAEPVLTPIPLGGGDRVAEMWAATPELALAWKLSWLETDSYPQGKDLYDATLLAEQTTLRLSLLQQVLDAAGFPPARRLEPGFPLEWEVDWEEFVREYPWVTGEACEWQSRLARAMAPTFDSGVTPQAQA